MSNTSDDTTQSPPGENCPVCGQEYDHFRVDDPEDRTVIRNDATECRVEEDEDATLNRTWKVYVHVA